MLKISLLMRKPVLILMILLLFYFIYPSLQCEAQEEDKLSGKNVKRTYIAKSGEAFELIITDDATDDTISKGKVEFFADWGSFENPFELEKGKSAKFKVEAEDKVEKVVITLKEGSILINSGGKLRKEAGTAEAKATKPAVPLPRGSFSAEMVTDMEGEKTSSQFFLSDHLYRFDAIIDNIKQAMIVDRKSGKVWLLNLDEKSYGVTSTDDQGIYLFNPFEAHYWMATKFNITSKGEEKVDGLLCEKKELTDGNLLVQAVWISKKYQFPIKLINYKDGKQHYMAELRNPKEERIKADVFEVPKDFKQLK